MNSHEAPRWRARGVRGALLCFLAIAALALAAGSAAAPGTSDLKITKADSPDPVHVGETLMYTLGVENLGPTAASGIVVTDSLPRGVLFVSANSSTGDCAPKGRNVTCRLGQVGNGVNYGPPAAVTLSVIPQRAGMITNRASVKGDGKDPVPSNNKATATTQVLAGASCRGFAATIVGTAGRDVLTGTGGPDVIAALGGDDTIRSLAGRDLVCAGRGRDLVVAGPAADRVFANAGGDRVFGRGGPDLLNGGAGGDVLHGNRGSDRLRGGAGFDRCRGGPGADSIRGCERQR